MRSPEFASVRSVHQVGLHRYFIAVLRNAAHQDRADLQLLADLLRIVVLSLEAEDRASRHHFKIWHLRQSADQALGQAIAKVFIVGIGGRVHEGQHRKRVNLPKPKPAAHPIHRRA